MKIEIFHHSQTNNHPQIKARCPHCGREGTFDQLLQYDLASRTSGNITYILGIRRCPNNKCNGHLFFIVDNANGETIMTYPSESIPFDKDKIPENILSAFEEAVICHSNNCFTASGIMVRKTLEEICADQNAQGNNLYNRISKLGSKSIIPNELLEAMQELRLVGNNAAHVKAREYAKIGKEEIEVSIELTKEILKAVYQYENLLIKLRDLKNSKKDQD